MNWKKFKEEKPPEGEEVFASKNPICFNDGSMSMCFSLRNQQ